MAPHLGQDFTLPPLEETLFNAGLCYRMLQVNGRKAPMPVQIKNSFSNSKIKNTRKRRVLPSCGVAYLCQAHFPLGMEATVLTLTGRRRHAHPEAVLSPPFSCPGCSSPLRERRMSSSRKKSFCATVSYVVRIKVLALDFIYPFISLHAHSHTLF